ncbi:MAG TPA: FMN-binding negative transcriptional regulator [Steroidobacteraceae bacterium]|jgi:transcriptional regulator|nr:FMN-binding negative transcriptional regulator [Steroidobacteraceae bacterium]
MTPPRLLFAPDAYAAADPVAIVRRYPFAQFISAGPTDLLATAIPLFFERDGDTATMVGHLARRNLHASALQSGQRALAIFAGPHAYISSRWYQDRPTVPTWNYVTAHVRGTIEPIDDEAAQRAILRLTARMMESDTPTPWTLEQAPPGRVDELMPRIRSLRLRVERIEGVTKLSQTHPPGDRVRVMQHLLERNDEGSHEIARWMAGLGIDQ